jgi:hypothetical protein
MRKRDPSARSARHHRDGVPGGPDPGAGDAVKAEAPKGEGTVSIRYIHEQAYAVEGARGPLSRFPIICAEPTAAPTGPHAPPTSKRLSNRLHPTAQGWRGFNNPWMAPPAEGEEEEDYLYINLLNNPERYTGYKVCAGGGDDAKFLGGGGRGSKVGGVREENVSSTQPANSNQPTHPPNQPTTDPQGEHAHRIWSAIYDTIDCAAREAGECAEARVFYRCGRCRGVAAAGGRGASLAPSHPAQVSPLARTLLIVSSPNPPPHPHPPK